MFGARSNARQFGGNMRRPPSARRIAGGSRHRHQPADRADVDDRRPLRPLQERQRRLGDVERAGQVDREHPVPAVGRKLGKRRDVEHPGGVDQPVEPAERCRRYCNDPIDHRPVGDVAVESPRCLVRRGPLAIEQRQARTVPGEQFRDGLPDAAGRSRDEDAAADQLLLHVVPIAWLPWSWLDAPGGKGSPAPSVKHYASSRCKDDLILAVDDFANPRAPIPSVDSPRPPESRKTFRRRSAQAIRRHGPPYSVPLGKASAQGQKRPRPDRADR